MTDREILKEAQARFKLAADAEAEARAEALDDLRFISGEQWPDEIKHQRDVDGRPCLVVNRLPQFVAQVVNDARQNRAAIKVNPVDDVSDPETAELMQGLIRHIETTSDADTAYDQAMESAVIGGFGHWRILTEYADQESFDQEIRIEPIPNPFMVYWDPAAKFVDRSDARFCLIVADMAKSEFEAAYPDSESASLANLSSIGDRAPGWAAGEMIRVAEYFRVSEEEYTLCLIQTDQGAQVLPKSEVPKGYPIDKERTARRRKVTWYKLNGIEVLEKQELPGQWIPVVSVFGQELNIEGKKKLISLVRHAKDPQRMYNYWASAETEAIALAPKSPWIVAEGQLEGYEQQWQASNVRNLTFLTYKPRTANGQQLPPPTRNVFEPAIQAITQARMMAADDMKATTGIYDSSLGNRSNETSGKAILARQREGDIATFHFVDNLARAIRHTGRILIDLIPRIYDTARVVRILGEDGSVDTKPVNTPVVEQGIERIYDLTTGKYDVTVSVGPSYSTKRQEAAESMMALTQAYPPLMQVAGDLMVRNMDWPGADDMAERLKKTLPPQLQDKNDEQQPIPPQVQAQMQALMQQHEQLTQALTTLQGEVETKKVELDSRERIAELQEETKRLQIQATSQIEMAKLGSQEAVVQLQAELAAIKQSIELQHAADMTAMQQQHERIMAPDPSPEHEAVESPAMEAQEHATGLEAMD